MCFSRAVICQKERDGVPVGGRSAIIPLQAARKTPERDPVVRRSLLKMAGGANFGRRAALPVELPPVLPWLLPASVLAFAHYLQFLGQQPMKASIAAESVSSCRASLMAFFSCVSSEMVNLKVVTMVFFLRHAFHSVKSVE